MIDRAIWTDRIEQAWRERRIVWLSGPRRLGKTMLGQAVSDAVYFDCELPSVRRDLEDTENFLRAHRGKRLILDEVHRLANPSEVLKVAADHFPGTYILATGSSTLGASARFRDTLAGRKRTIRMRPVLFRELAKFGVKDLAQRMLHGGLPEHLLADRVPDKDFSEWLEAFWARDVLELFAVSKRYSFLRFLELLWAQSGGLCQLTSFTSPCEASRQTLANYLDILDVTGVITVLRPFSSNPNREIVSMPKAYAFDTGFVCHVKGWNKLRPEDMGMLWEHLVLDELLFLTDDMPLHYWRDKQKREIDLVLHRKGKVPVAIECKWKLAQFNPSAFASFRELYPGAECWVIAHDRAGIFRRSGKGYEIVEAGLGDLGELLKG
jgi:hypothetical protein